MPIYEYECRDCGLKFELLRPLSQAGEKACCPQCNRDALRVMSKCASFSKSESGEAIPLAGTGSSCSGCGASTCSSCGL